MIFVTSSSATLGSEQALRRSSDLAAGQDRPPKPQHINAFGILLFDPTAPQIFWELSVPTVLITGCDSGLGVEFARQYAAHGWRVLATCLDPETARETRAIKGDISVKRLDISDHAEIAALAEELRGDAIDILLSNAGIGRPHPPFGETDYVNWRRILEVNLIGPMRLAESFVGHVAKSDRKVMAFVSSRMGSIALNLSGGSYAYRSSKAGLNAVVRSLAVDLARLEICVLALHPGWAKTEPGGRVEVKDSVAGMRGVIDRAGRHHTGSFVTYGDQPLPW
jgi:NAD(P)-dependent dehydrogenase (short-subunit alcohol dehydrogenase family)